MIDKNPAINANESYKKEKKKKIENKPENLKTNKARPLSEFENKWNMNNKIIELFASNIQKDQKLRGRYAIILIAILTVQLLALIIIFVLKGCNVLDYSDSTFNLFITGGIAEVFTLIMVIVKYLFNDNLTEALKIILTNNNQVKNINEDKETK